jgi:hypothetical protein
MDARGTFSLILRGQKSVTHHETPEKTSALLAVTVVASVGDSLAPNTWDLHRREFHGIREQSGGTKLTCYAQSWALEADWVTS